MRLSRIPLVLAAAAMLTGCGDRNLIVHVDVLSYLDPAVTQIPVGPIPPQGGGGVFTGEIPIIQNAEVNLIDGTSSIAEVQNITVTMTVVSTGVTGSGADTLRLYMAAPGQDPVVLGAVATVRPPEASSSSQRRGRPRKASDGMRCRSTPLSMRVRFEMRPMSW